MRAPLGQATTPRPHPGPKLGVQGAQMVVLLCNSFRLSSLWSTSGLRIVGLLKETEWFQKNINFTKGNHHFSAQERPRRAHEATPGASKNPKAPPRAEIGGSGCPNGGFAKVK